VTEPFEQGGTPYSKGQIVTDEKFRALNAANKKKVGFDAVMEYTGESPEIETRKSFGESDMGLVDQDECCKY
jgi:hypothetical protein